MENKIIPSPEGIVVTKGWIAEQRAVCDAATPGPWESKHYGRYEDHDECCIALTDDSIEPSKYENADFIAAARTALPAALDALESYMQREAEKDAEIERLKDGLASAVVAGIRLEADKIDLCAQCATLTAERDAMMAALKDICEHCGFKGCPESCTGYSCMIYPITRGLCAENAPEGTTDVEHTTD